MYYCIAGTYSPFEYEEDCHPNDKGRKKTVRSVKYIPYPAQNPEDFTDLTKKTGISYDVSAKITIFGRFLESVNKNNQIIQTS